MNQAQLPKQTTLDKYLANESQDEDQVNLIAHLLEPSEVPHGTEEWTRVYSREELKSLNVVATKVGPDL